MKSEEEIRDYLEKVKKQVKIEEKMEHKYLILVGKTIICTLEYVLNERRTK